jgi:polysaccharide biosynthesis protein PslF
MQHFSYMPSFGILSTFAPTASGIATFSEALAVGLSARSATVSVVRIADGDASERTNVIGELTNGSAASIAGASELLNQSDIAVIQHEYGIYGGPDGDEVIKIMEKLSVPSIVVAHTVLDEPTPQQHSVLERVVKLADQVVAMSETARQRLVDAYPAERHKVVMISHDDPDATASQAAWHAVTDAYLSAARRLVAARMAQA